MSETHSEAIYDNGVPVVQLGTDRIQGGCFFLNLQYMSVSKNTGTPKWMVYNGKPY